MKPALMTPVLTIAMVMAAPTSSRAGVGDVIDDAIHDVGSLRELTVGTTQRLRRGLAIGPQIGGFVGVDTSSGDLVHGVSFGVGLYAFKVPSVLDLQDRLVAEVRRRVKARMAELVMTGLTSPADLKQVVRDIATEVKAELLGRPRRHTLEPPRFGALLEGTVLTSSGGGFQTRLVVSKGIGKVSLGLALAVQHAASATRFVPGLEASLRLTPFGVARTPVFELYLRGDVVVDSAHPVAILVGGRATLDLL